MLLLFSFLLFCFSRGVLPHLVRLDQHPWRQLRGRNPRLYRFLVTIALTLTLTGAGHAQFPGARPQPGVPASVRLRGYSAMCFETNRGQAPAVVSFLARGLGYSLFLTSDQAIFVLQGYAPVSHGPTQNAPGSTSAGTFTPLTTAVLRMELVGGRSLAHAAGATRLPGQVNYLTGKDLHTWHVHVPLYAAVQYRQVYPGIDLLYHGTQRQLEYDFIVAPHISARAIALRFKGATSLALDHSGGLVVAVGNRTVLWHRPVLYQTIRGRRKIVDGNYIIGKRQTVTFRVGAYDPAKPLVIDPILAYSTYLGASTIDYASAVTVGSDGCAYIAGRTGSTLFPNTSGLLDETKAGSFVTKLDPTGRRIVYTTYFGTFSSCGGIAVDTAGDAYVTGSTYTQITSDGSYNSDFPVTPGAYLSGIRTTAPISAGFLAELAPDGSRLLYATLLGGSQGSSGERIALEGHRRVYVAGNTSSLDFPVTPRGLHLPWVAPPHYRKVWQIQQTFVTAFAVERSSRASLVYSALLGNTTLRGFAVDSSGRAALTGMTSRQDFPVTPDALQPGFLGASGYPLDGFGPAQSAYVAELDNTGSPVYGTFLGGGTPLLPSGLALDQGGAIYLAAYAGSGVPTTAAHQATSSISGPFVMKIDPTRVGTSSLVYATYLGSLGNAQDNSSVGMVGQLRLTDTSAIAVNAAGDAYVTGSTDDPNFPTTPDAIEAAYNSRGQGAPTAFLSILDPSGTRLLWSSYLGEGGRTGGPALAIDRFGDAYVAGTTTFNLFTTTPGSYLQFPPGGLLDGFVLKVSGQVPSGPYIANLRPYPAFVGEGGQQITITGTGFVPGIAVSFNGGPPVSPTAFSPTRLSVTLPEQAAASPQPVLISVFNPPSGDWASAILPVIDPAPTVILLSPTSLAAHKGEDMIRIYGSGMVPGTMVSFNNGPPVPITYDMPSASFVTVPAGVLAHPGTVDVAVINPARGVVRLMPVYSSQTMALAHCRGAIWRGWSSLAFASATRPAREIQRRASRTSLLTARSWRPWMPSTRPGT